MELKAGRTCLHHRFVEEIAKGEMGANWRVPDFLGRLVQDEAEAAA